MAKKVKKRDETILGETPTVTISAAVQVKITEDKAAQIEGNDVSVFKIESTPLDMSTPQGTPICYVKLRDGSSSWGMGNFFICNRQIKRFPKNSFVLDGVNGGSLIEVTEAEFNEANK